MTKKSTVLAAAAALFLGVAGSAAADVYNGPGFSGTVWMAENGGPVKQLGTMNVGGGGFLMSMETQGQRVSSLIKWETENVWSLLHDQRMYMEIPPEQSGWEPYEAKACVGYDGGEKLGSETLGGRATEKWRCTGQRMVPQGEKPSDATVWYDPDLEFAIKSADDNGSVFEIRDIEVGAQDPSMFEVPAGYQKFDMNAMMQMMQQQGQQQ